MTNQEQYELLCEKSDKYDKMVNVLQEIRQEIKAAADKEFQIAGGINDRTERIIHLQRENAYRQCVLIVDNHISVESEAHDDD